MSDLRAKEKKFLELFFARGTPTNWFATHRDLNELFDQYELSKYGYKDFEGSKTERMRVIWRKCPNEVVSKLILELLEMGHGEQVYPD